MTRERFSDEPIVINADVVAETLERRGFERMAAWVLDVANRERRDAMLLEASRKHLSEALERLHKYEPPQREPENRVTWTGD